MQNRHCEVAVQLIRLSIGDLNGKLRVEYIATERLESPVNDRGNKFKLNSTNT